MLLRATISRDRDDALSLCCGHFEDCFRMRAEDSLNIHDSYETL